MWMNIAFALARPYRAMYVNVDFTLHKLHILYAVPHTHCYYKIVNATNYVCLSACVCVFVGVVWHFNRNCARQIAMAFVCKMVPARIAHKDASKITNSNTLFH